MRSLALAVDDLSAVLLVLLLGDPVRGKGGQRTKGGATGPDGVVSVSGSDDVDDTLLWAELVQLLLQSIGETLVEGGASRADDVLVQVGSHIKIALRDGSESQLVETLSLVSLLDEVWLEDTLWSLETRSVHVDGLAIRELEGLLVVVGGRSLTNSGLVVLSNEAALLLDGSHDLEPGALATLLSDAVLSKELNEEVGDHTTGDEVLKHGVRDGEALIDWDGVGDTISRVSNKTSGSTIGVEGEDGLNGNVETIDVEGLEHELGHLLSVGLRVSRSLGEEDVVLRWVNSELVVEAVLPDLLHIVPGLDDTRLDWVVELQDTSHLLGLVTNVLRLGVNTNELLVGSWNTDNSWELHGGLVFAGKTSLEDTRSVVNNNVLSHVVLVVIDNSLC